MSCSQMVNQKRNVIILITYLLCVYYVVAQGSELFLLMLHGGVTGSIHGRPFGKQIVLLQRYSRCWSFRMQRQATKRINFQK